MTEKKYKLATKLTVISTVIAIISVLLPQAHAATYKANNNKRITVEISQTGVNRIEVKKDRIAKVIGNNNEYSIEGDSKTGVIFLSAKAIAGEILPITIITEKGYTQDINLKVKKINEPQTIIIEKPVLQEAKSNLAAPQDIKEQVVEAIRDISKGQDRNFTKRDISKKEIANYQKQHSPTHNPSSNLIFKGYQALTNQQIVINKVSEYSNRSLRLIKYEYERKPTATGLKEISSLFKDALSVSERGNVIMVVYQI